MGGGLFLGYCFLKNINLKYRLFYFGAAKVNRNATCVTVSSKKVKNPVAVRYAWRNFVVGTLYDANLLPASSFRTDDWDDAKISVE